MKAISSIIVPALDLMLLFIILMFIALVSVQAENKTGNKQEMISTIHSVNTNDSLFEKIKINSLTAIVLTRDNYEICQIQNSKMISKLIFTSTDDIDEYIHEDCEYILYNIEQSPFFFDIVISILRKNSALAIAE